MERRAFFKNSAALAGAAVVAPTLLTTEAQAMDVLPFTLEMAMKEFTHGKEAKEGKIDLDVPAVAENGLALPVKVSVESPMTDDDYVKHLTILSSKAKDVRVARVNFTPLCGTAYYYTKCKLGGPENDIYAIAEMSNGDIYMVKKFVKANVAGCG